MTLKLTLPVGDLNIASLAEKSATICRSANAARSNCRPPTVSNHAIIFNDNSIYIVRVIFSTGQALLSVVIK